MPAVPYATLTVSVDGAAYTSSSVTVSAGAVLRFRGENTSGWDTQRFELYGFPDGFATPAGWTLGADGVIYYEDDALPPDVTMPTIAYWGKWGCRLIVNGQIPTSNAYLLDESLSVSLLGPFGEKGIHYLEAGQFDSLQQWVGEMMDTLRAMGAAISGSAGYTTYAFPSDANQTLAASVYTKTTIYATGGTALGATRNLVVTLANVATGKKWAIHNYTNGAQSIQIIGDSGTGITVPQNECRNVIYNGTNIVLDEAAGAGTTPTGTGFTHITAGVQDAAAKLVENADVDAAAAIAGSKVSPDFGAQNVTTTGAALLGAAPRSTVGDVRGPSTFELWKRNNGNTADIPMLRGDTSEGITLGATTGTGATVTGTIVAGSGGYIAWRAASAIYNQINSNDIFTLDANNALTAKPIIGDASASSPYSVHGAVEIAMSDANYSATAAQYKYNKLRATGAHTGIKELTMPNPATLAASYDFEFENATTGGFGVDVWTGAGTKIRVAAGMVARLRAENSDMKRVSADCNPDT